MTLTRKLPFVVSRLLIFGISLSIAPFIAHGHHAVLQFNLEEMISTADRIFVGKCLDVQETEEMIAGGMMPVTIYTFEVGEVIKGKLPARFTFRQLGWRSRPAKGSPGEITMHGKIADPRSAMVHGMSQYQVGDELLLMLIPNYLQGKATYAVGLYQGAFLMQKNSAGVKQVRNSINNQGLFTNSYNGFTKSLQQSKFLRPGDRSAPILHLQLKEGRVEDLVAKRGALPAEPFIDLVRQITRGE